ncbi:MAG: septation protein SepH [Microbacterium sp.]
MDQLTIVGCEDGEFVLASESGDRFTLPIDDILRSELRRADRAARREDRPLAAVSPREIQQHIRAGLSSDEVAELLGARVEDVRRFEGPVLAEREHIIERALAVPVLMGVDITGEQNHTFGAAIREKLDDLKATGERWTSWKDDGTWYVKLEFTAADVAHDARWSFDAPRAALAPVNADATRLSRQGKVTSEGLIPRLRALDHTPKAEDERFDGEEFGPRALSAQDQDEASDGLARTIRDVATKHAPTSSDQDADTADLLEALRRRRGRREAAPTLESEQPAPVALFDAPVEEAVEVDDVEEAERSPEPAARRRGGRTAMPSWDEIVFGARADD